MIVVVFFVLSGCAVDILIGGVSGVKALTEDQLREVPSLVTSIDTKSIVGPTTVEQQLLILNGY